MMEHTFSFKPPMPVRDRFLYCSTSDDLMRSEAARPVSRRSAEQKVTSAEKTQRSPESKLSYTVDSVQLKVPTRAGGWSLLT